MKWKGEEDKEEIRGERRRGKKGREEDRENQWSGGEWRGLGRG